ncbi:MBL fold metallo-hydrolase [Raoultibacter phocaeensis]|uniref:MBL fold metallo-hydrolase n=1 Tax=Raoultibacter phocaeensis TaxID=2479841 RepID=UPI0011192268|nr:MBL fold metallo-hydrolase [Raoultibacter phocaeensis]
MAKRLIFSEIVPEVDAHASTGSSASHRLELHVLASGSGGNASVIVDSQTGGAIVIDCGICKRDFFARLNEAGIALGDIAGILVTHEHTDHTKGLGVVLRGMRKLGFEPPVFASDAVRDSSSEIGALRESFDVRPYCAEHAFSLGGMEVHPFATSHDSVESYGFRIGGALGDTIGFMTDTGIVTDAALAHLEACRILAIESNHDAKMLAEGPYPYVVKRRIASDGGHLSNEQSADLLERLLCAELEQVIAMHVSENNNTYRLPEDSLASVIARNAHGACVQVAYQHMRVSAR